MWISSSIFSQKFRNKKNQSRHCHLKKKNKSLLFTSLVKWFPTMPDYTRGYYIENPFPYIFFKNKIKKKNFHRFKLTLLITKCIISYRTSSSNDKTETRFSRFFFFFFFVSFPNVKIIRCFSIDQCSKFSSLCVRCCCCLLMISISWHCSGWKKKRKKERKVVVSDDRKEKKNIYLFFLHFPSICHYVK